MPDQISKSEPSWRDLERVLLLTEAQEITSLSVDTLKRRYADRVVRLSPRRLGIKLRHVLEITAGK